MTAADVAWRADLDALTFRPKGRAGACFVHRRAFRALAGAVEGDACLEFFVEHRDAFERAAEAKIMRRNVPDGQNFHLTSRDIRRSMALPLERS